MGSTRRTFQLAIAISGVIPTYAHAFDLGDIAEVFTAPITAPYEATKKILEGDDPTEVITGPIEAGGRIVQQTVETADKVQSAVLSVPRDLIRRNLGDGWADGFDILTASERVKFEMQLTAGRFLGNCLQGQNCSVQAVAAMPVAASMRDAYKMYNQYATEFEFRFQQYLSPAVPPHVLAAARFTVGSVPNLTVPGFLNSSGISDAVTLGNLIVFAEAPDLRTCGGIELVIHELRHVEQYMSYSQNILESIDGFAIDYITNFDSMEEDARKAGSVRLQYLGNFYNFHCPS